MRALFASFSEENMVERWLPVVGFEGLYEVSDQGRIRSMRRSRILSVGTPNRYCNVSLSVDGKNTVRSVHRLVLEAFRGFPPSDQEGAHLNGNRADNRLANLQWKTRVENHADKRIHGTQCCGETHGRAKLTSVRLKLARRLRERGFSDVLIARKFGVHSGTIARALAGRTWA